MRDLFADSPLRVNHHVRVIGLDHPHFGKEGIITEFLGVFVPIGSARAMIKLDDGTGFIIVTLRNLGSSGKAIHGK